MLRDAQIDRYSKVELILLRYSLGKNCVSNSIIIPFQGQCGIVECAYVRSDVAPVKYFANPLQLGRNGVEMNYGYGCLNSYERSLFYQAIPSLEKSIKKGDEWKPNPKGASK